MPVNSRMKGKGFERKVANSLSVWWGEPFRSTPGSGNLHWQKDQRVRGDIVPPVDSKWPFSVECKKHEGWNFEQILKDTGDTKSWYEQCTRDATETSKYPLLIFSKNRSPVYFMMPKSIYFCLPRKEDTRYFITWVQMETFKQTVVIGFLDDLVALPSKDVLESIQLFTSSIK